MAEVLLVTVAVTFILGAVVALVSGVHPLLFGAVFAFLYSWTLLMQKHAKKKTGTVHT